MNLFRVLRVCVALLCTLNVAVFVHAQNHAGIQTPLLISKLEIPPPHADSITAVCEQTQAYVFAYPLKVSIPLIDVASAFYVDSIVEYKLCITSSDAVSLNLIFSDFFLPKNATLSIFSEDSTCFFGPYTYTQNSSSGVFATPIVEGNILYLSLSVPIKYVENVHMRISQISYGFRSFKTNQKSELKSSGDCNVDINCSEGADWQLQKRSVCKIIISGTHACTGALLNNTLQDGTPYILTANHCVSNQAQANETVFYFGYEKPQCGYGYASENKTMSGSKLRATAPDARVDFALLEINQNIPDSYEPYYAGWDASEDVSKKSVCIHHPKGDVKKISIDNDIPKSASFYSYAPHSHWEIADWEVGTTESGSSGAPIFNANHQIFGSLSGGQASCYSPIYDYFSKFSTAFNKYLEAEEQLQVWLDPLNYNITNLHGFDPLHSTPSSLSNITKNDSVMVWNFDSHAHGYFAGTNNIGWTSVADKFAFVAHKNIARITYAVDVLPCADLSNIELCVWNGQTTPDSVLFSTLASHNSLIDSTFLCVIPQKPIETNGNFWIGYRYLNPDSCVSFQQAYNRTNSSNQMHVLYENAWIPVSEISAYTALAVEVYCTNDIDTLPLFMPCEKPFFKDAISSHQYSFYSKELFDIDSIPGMYDTTMYMHVSTKNNVDDWAQAETLEALCIANKYIHNTTDYIRGLSLGIREIYDTSANIHLVLWSEYGKKLAETEVKNSKLTLDFFNQVHFDNPVFVQNSFYAGICFDTESQLPKTSLYTYYDNNIFIDSYFYTSNTWLPYSDIGVPYNFAIQPIICYSPYHFNADSAQILTYPIKNIGSFEFTPTKKCIVFPSYCSNEFFIRWNYSLYSPVRVELYSTSGILYQKQEVDYALGAYRVPIQHIPSGIYIVRVVTDYFVEEQKITVHR